MVIKYKLIFIHLISTSPLQIPGLIQIFNIFNLKGFTEENEIETNVLFSSP